MNLKFKRVYVEITNVCNLSCTFCAGTKREKKFMSLDNFEKIVAALKDVTDTIYLHVMGEPLLHPQFEEILEICANHKMFVNITTNGSLLASKLTAITSSKIVKQINISLQAIIQNSDLISNVFECTKVLTNSKIVCTLRIWALKETEQIIKKIENAFNVEINSNDLSGNLKIAPYLFIGKEEEFVWPSKANCSDETGFCYGLRSHFAVLVDGSVVPCCLDSEGDIILGNILKSDIKEILFSNKAQDIYNGFSQNKVSETLCRKCSYKNHFKKT